MLPASFSFSSAFAPRHHSGQDATQLRLFLVHGATKLPRHLSGLDATRFLCFLAALAPRHNSGQYATRFLCSLATLAPRHYSGVYATRSLFSLVGVELRGISQVRMLPSLDVAFSRRFEASATSSGKDATRFLCFLATLAPRHSLV
jgi:hypothetical protein